MTKRHILPNRRGCETFEIKHQDRVYTVSIGRFLDGGLAEVFVTGQKAGSDLEAIGRDAAVALSIALQHQVPLVVLRHAVTREQDGLPSSIIGAVLDHIGESG